MVVFGLKKGFATPPLRTRLKTRDNQIFPFVGIVSPRRAWPLQVGSVSEGNVPERSTTRLQQPELAIAVIILDVGDLPLETYAGRSLVEIFKERPD